MTQPCMYVCYGFVRMRLSNGLHDVFELVHKVPTSIVQGKPKTLQEGQGEELEPTCEFDSHMSVKFQRGKKMMYEVVYDVSQVSSVFLSRSCQTCSQNFY